MRAAIMFIGRIKTYEEQLEYLLKLQKKYDLDVFCSLNLENLDEYHQTFLDALNVKKFHFEKAPYNIDWNNYATRYVVIRPNMVSHFYNSFKCFQLIEEYQKENNFTYDIIIKFRADIISSEELNLEKNVEPNNIFIPSGWDHCGINDQVAYGDYNTMKLYCDVYNRIENMCNNGCDFHPETLILRLLINNNIRINRFNYNYNLNSKRDQRIENEK